MEKSSNNKYSSIVNYIKDQIHTGNYRIGELLPGQRVIAEMLSVSRPSVKRAIDVLEKEGILECKPSIGTVIIQSPAKKILIGYLVQDLQDPFHIEVIRELDILLHKYHGGLITAQGSNDSRLLTMGITHEVKHFELYSNSRQDRVPTVYIGSIPCKTANMVISDVNSATNQIYKHLKNLGHKKCAYAGPFYEENDPIFSSLALEFAKDNNHIRNEDHFLVNPLNESECEMVVKTIMESKSPPTALICHNDWLAIAIMKAAKIYGLDIPIDLSIIGYDDLYISSLLQVPLTTIQFSRKKTAEKVMEILMKSSYKSGIVEIIDTKLIVRDSTRSIKKR